MQTNTAIFTMPSQARTMHLTDVSTSEARTRLRAALLREGFAVIADVDLGDLLSRRLDEGLTPYFIIEACHPMTSRQALAVAWDGGLLAPTRFAVWKEGNGATIATFAPERLATALGRLHTAEMSRQLDERIDGVFEQLEVAATGEAATPEGPAELDLDDSERQALQDATRRHIDELMREAAKTDSRPLQHELAQTIDRLETIARKLGAAPSPAQ
jgi:uncharacterized protein (DUF302 family)